MAWMPTYVIDGGMYGGKNCPAGSLTGLVQICPNSWAGINIAAAAGSRAATDPDYQKWEGAYGMSDNLIKQYMLNHRDNQQHTFDLAELAIENPQGAQFYKQSIVFKATTLSNTVEIPGTGLQYLRMMYYEISIEAYRREYPTPYSAYTDTLIATGTSGINGYYFYDGDEELGGWLYSLTDRLLIALGTFTYENKEYFGIALYKHETRCDNLNSGWAASVLGYDQDYLNQIFGAFEPEETDDPNEDPDEDDDGESGEGGGHGEHEKKYDPIPIPPMPDVGPIGAGFVYMLRMGTATMQTFAAELLDPSWWAALKAFFADPMDFICGIMIVPFTPTSTRNVTPKFGNNTMNHSFPEVTYQYHEIDCGEIYISRYYDSCFDNNPYTSIKIWLPYIGYRDLDVDEIMGKNIHVVYHCDCMTGDVVAFIESKGAGNGQDVSRVIAQFSGNCGVRVPFGANSYDAAVAASIQLLGGAVGMVAGGAAAPAGLAAGAISESQIASTIGGATMAAVVGNKVNTERSGTAGATAGYFSIQYPYIFKTVPRQSRPGNFKELEGYPSNIKGPLSNYSGFVAVETINLNGISATREELNELESLLRQGVYI